jgi:hypothetical protein
MTTDVHPDADLAAGRAVLDAIPPAAEAELDAIRRRLDSGRRARRSPLRRRGVRLALAAGLAAVAVAAMALAPGGRRSSHRPLAPPTASAAERIAKAMDLAHAVVHYTVTSSLGGLDVSYETWATAAGSVSIGHEGAKVVERGTTPTSASIWSPERNEVVTASTASEAGGGDGLSLDEVSVAVRDGRATVTETTLDGAPALKATARGGALFFDPKTLVPLRWWLTDPAGKPTIVYRVSGFAIRPLDASTASLVDLAARHPGAKAVNDPALYDQLEQAAEGG